ncbi:MAG: GNAT family N-acetyltransferase, partial [Pseudomonadota bacterium]
LAAIGHWCAFGWGKFAIEEKASGSFVGFCGPAMDDGWPEPEISYSLVPAFHRKGYAFEAVKRVLKFAYTDLGWQTAVSQIDKDNPASQRVSEKLGATKEEEGVVFANYVADIWRHLPPQEFLKAEIN